jgi:hypothetical protein
METVSLDNMAEIIFDEATSGFSETFDEADLIMGSYDRFGISFTETKLNVNECQQLIAKVKQIVDDSYSHFFEVSIEREVCDDDEFPDDVATITIYLNCGKLYKNS